MVYSIGSILLEKKMQNVTTNSFKLFSDHILKYTLKHKKICVFAGVGVVADN